MKELKNTVVNVKTQAEYDELMEMYEEAGWKWLTPIKIRKKK